MPRTSNSSPTSTPETHRSLADHAFETLRDRLIFLDILPGSPINESALSEEMGIGRTPLREALKRLETQHLVVTHSRRGTFATSVDITTLTEISQVREVLEPLAARLAVKRRGGDVREHLHALAAELTDHDLGHPDRHEPLRADRRVHHAISQASGNAHLQATVERYGHLATRLWCVVADRLDDLQRHVDGHESLILAVLDGDEDTAEALMRRHVQEFEAAIRLVL